MPPSVQLLQPHVKDLGGFTVKRLLPAAACRAVGPFVFFDHMGPAELAPGNGLDVRPHPHIGLATVTYLFEGVIDHRDSLGTIQPIKAGDVNWMTAGRGIVHSERSPASFRQSGGPMHGLQTWVALPREDEGTEPFFEHHPAATIPQIDRDGVQLRVIAGSAFGHTAPARTFSPLFYVVAEFAPGGRLQMPEEYAERAVYALHGELVLDGETIPVGCMAVLQPGIAGELLARGAARAMLLGGAPLDGERFLWWNFVASERGAIEAAKERWRKRQFGSVPGETEWIPLPEEPKPPQPFS
jgi:redox-sensitive bicupin YhaK (pirin superfamily)